MSVLALVAVFLAGLIVGLWVGPATERLDAAHTDGWLAGYDQGRTVDPQIADLVGKIARGETESQRESHP